MNTFANEIMQKQYLAISVHFITILCIALVFTFFGCSQDQSEIADNNLSRLEQAANRGDVSAQLRLGKIYRDGRLVTQDYVTAAQWYRKAAEKGDAEAEKLLGICYATGIGVANSTDEATFWLRCASNHGNADAQFYLGCLFDAADKEDESMAEWLKAARSGNVAAQTTIGFILLESDEWKDQRDGVAWLRKAAEKGDSSAQWRLGTFLCESIDVSRNREEAISWHRKSAEQGNRNARDSLVEMGESNVPPADFLTCTTLGFPMKLPIPDGFEPADSVKQAALELESSVLGDSVPLPVLYYSKDLDNPSPFAKPSCIRLIYSPGRKASLCPDDETWERMRRGFLDSIDLSSRTLSIASGVSLRSDGEDMGNLKPISGSGWVGRYSVINVRSGNSLDALKGGLMFSGLARIRDQVISVSVSNPTGTRQDPIREFPTTVERFLPRLYELNKAP